MFRISRFQQLMQGLPRGTFQSMVESYEADKYTKGFGCLSLLIAQVFGHVSGSRSLRELEAGYNAHPSHHYHLGTGPIRRATLADACARRNPAVFEALARSLMGVASRTVRRQVEDGLLLLDSTSFTLAGRGFEWAQARRTRNTQGLKLHLVYDLGCATPVLQEITAANVNDVTQAACIPLRRGATYVFDKGYCDYGWWARFDDQGARFITRLKTNARIALVQARPVPEDASNVLADELIRLSNTHPGGKRRNAYTATLRRVTIARPDKASPLVLVTNDLARSAAEVAACYKARWQIELFFKWIKQNLRIRSFLGRSENAVRIQILCALITYLLVALYRQAHAPGTQLLRVLDELRVGLFQRPVAEAVVERRRRTRLLAQAAVQPRLFA
jgi:putative transposase